MNDSWIESIAPAPAGWVVEIATDAGKTQHLPVLAVALAGRNVGRYPDDQVIRTADAVLADGRLARSVPGFRRLLPVSQLRRERRAAAVKRAVLALRSALPRRVVEFAIRRVRHD